MATITEPRIGRDVNCFVFDGVRWDDYEAMLRIVGDRPIRVSYDRGRLEIMSPLWARGNADLGYLYSCTGQHVLAVGQLRRTIELRSPI